MAFENYTNIHLVGIKGVAMTSLAQCLIDLGKKITGSDIKEDFVTKTQLSTLDIRVNTSFHKDNIFDQIELLIYSGSHNGSQNPEVKEARRKNIPVMSHAEALGELTRTKKTISVCGVGGKSTTSAMIAWILEYAGKHPSFSVGVGNIPNLKRIGRYTQSSEYFVAEADEYAVDPAVNTAPRFSYQTPFCIVCTNIAHDHPDIYPSFEDTKQVFGDFFSMLPNNGTLIINADDTVLTEIEKNIRNDHVLITVGKKHTKETIKKLFSDHWFFYNYCLSKGKNSLTLVVKGKEYSLTLHQPGLFNLRNALYAIAVAKTVGISIQTAIKALAKFQGTLRRFENMRIKQGVQYYDDYAHHPLEIIQTLRAAREWYPNNRIIAIFQPHTYSRTKKLFNKFSQAFHDASEVILLDIFASARESFDSSISSDDLAIAIQKNHVKAKNCHSLIEVHHDLRSSVSSGDVVITLGAGDVYKLHEMIQ